MLSISHPKPTTSLRPKFREAFLPKFHPVKYKPKFKFAVFAKLLPFSQPPQAPPGQVYQPFRPPPTAPLPPQYRRLDVTELLDVLRNRLGLWYEYAPIISTLSRDGFTPASIEEVTGISGVEQNCLVVAAQVRLSLVLSETFPQEMIAFFDSGGGPELLYELRLLNTQQRIDSAALLINHRMEPRGSMELARAIRDFPRRRGDSGWDSFYADSPGDCLAYTQFRLSKETLVENDRVAALQKALDYVETEKARAKIMEEMEKGKDERKKEEEELAKEAVAVTVVRLRYGEIAEATSVILLPVVKELDGAKGLADAPGKCKSEGELGVVVAERGWGRWVVVPSWAPVAEAEEAVALEVLDGRRLPWKSMQGVEETVLVVVDRASKDVELEGAYVVERDGRLVVERGRRLKANGVDKAVAAAVLVVRPPREQNDMIGDDEWD